MPAYIVAVVRVDDWSDMFQAYADRSAELTAKYGAEYMIRGKPESNVEGELFNDRVIVVSKFPTLDAAKAFWSSDEYQNEIKHLRDNTGIYDIAIFEAA
jgi:uncharacterized protein (DUF1330 family)